MRNSIWEPVPAAAAAMRGPAGVAARRGRGWIGRSTSNHNCCGSGGGKGETLAMSDQFELGGNKSGEQAARA